MLRGWSFREAKHISEPELRYSVPVGNLTFSLAQLTSGIEFISDAAWGRHATYLVVLFFKIVKCSLRKHEISFVWVVFDWLFQHNAALLQAQNSRAFN
jgi:hypothetical protein